MNETINQNNASDAPRPTSAYRMREPDTSMLPDSEKDAPTAVGLMKQAVQGAHATIDRLADGAAPAVQQLSDSVSATESALHAKADELRETRDKWADGVRTMVRGNPLLSVAAAVTLGAVIAHITRRSPRTGAS